MALQGIEGQPACMVCLDKLDPYHHFVCSADGCGGTPQYMAVMERGDNSWALLCRRHLEEAKGSIMSFLGVPSWLTTVKNFDANDGDVMLDLEGDLDAEALAACIDGHTGPTRRTRP